MQPYFLPYIGYFQLIAAADRFVVYDNIKYTKKGWINRNRMLRNGTDHMFSLPLKSGSDSLDIRAREVAPEFSAGSFLNQIKGAYGKAPFAKDTLSLLEKIVSFEDRNLFRFLHNAIHEICGHLDINTPIIASSEIAIDHDLKAQDKVLALCNELHADAYVNPIGGVELYDRDVFREHGVDLHFLRSTLIEYEQFGNPFVPSLSIVDVLMFNPPAVVSDMVLKRYELV